jgi:hypothetical protein
MNARLLSIYLYPTYYKVVGYLDHEAFIIEIDNTSKQLIKYHSLGCVLRKYAQDFVYDCAMQTINNNLLNIQLIQDKAISENIVDPIEHNMDSNELADILRKVTNQDAVDQIRNLVSIVV